jgi:hypothetical protein
MSSGWLHHQLETNSKDMQEHGIDQLTKGTKKNTAATAGPSFLFLLMEGYVVLLGS